MNKKNKYSGHGVSTKGCKKNIINIAEIAILKSKNFFIIIPKTKNEIPLHKEIKK